MTEAQQAGTPPPSPRRAPAVPGILIAKNKVMAKVRGVRKDRVNPHHKFKYTGHDDVTEALQLAFIEYGIDQQVTVLESSRSEGLLTLKVRVTWTALEDGSAQSVDVWGESESKKSSRTGDETGQSLQGGQALSYAVKVAQLKNFMLVGGGIDDNEQGSGAPAPSPGRPQSAAQAAVSEEQVRLMVDEYASVTTREKLNELRLAVGTMMSALDEVSMKRLERADNDAAQRVLG